MPKRLQSVTRPGDCGGLCHAKPVTSPQEGLDSFSKSKNGHSGPQALITAEVTITNINTIVNVLFSFSFHFQKSNLIQPTGQTESVSFPYLHISNHLLFMAFR